MENLIYNSTPHALNIVEGATFNTEIRKYQGGKVINSIPSHGMLSVKSFSTTVVEMIDGIRVTQRIPEGIDEPPTGYKYIFCSALYANAYNALYPDNTYDFVVGENLVVDEDGKTPIGVTGLTLI